MDTRTGEIKMMEEWARKIPQSTMDRLFTEGKMQQVEPANLTEKQQEELKATGRTKIGKNDPCPCGSGKKFKKCCFFYGVRDRFGRIMTTNRKEE